MSNTPKMMLTLEDLRVLATTAERNGTQHSFVEVALQWAAAANAEIVSWRANARDSGVEARRYKVDLAAANARMRVAHDELMNMQPHIAELPKQYQPFIDSHVDAAMIALDFDAAIAAREKP